MAGLSDALASSGLVHSPGRIPSCLICPAIVDISPKFSLPRVKSSPEQQESFDFAPFACQPSSITENGLLSQLVTRSDILSVYSRISVREFFPYAKYQSLMPYTGFFGSIGASHII